MLRTTNHYIRCKKKHFIDTIKHQIRLEILPKESFEKSYYINHITGMAVPLVKGYYMLTLEQYKEVIEEYDNFE